MKYGYLGKMTILSKFFIQSWKNIHRLFKNSDKFLKTSKQIIYFSFLIFVTIAPPPSTPPLKINFGWTEQGSQDLQRPANIVFGGRVRERKVYKLISMIV